MRTKRLYLGIIFLLAAMLSGCGTGGTGGGGGGAGETTWDFLVYMSGDNNLESYAIDDFNEMETVGSDSRVNVLVLLDRAPGWDSSNGDWTGTRLYLVTRDTSSDGVIRSTLLHDYGELDMSDPAVLTDFVVYCQQNYPADRTILTLWDHGGGVYPRSVRPDSRMPRGIIWDDSTPGFPWNCLTTDEVSAALEKARSETGKGIDIINMDACVMQMLEVAYEWRGVADYLVGSQDNVPADGNDYQRVLTRLTGNTDQTPRAFASGLVDDYYSVYDSPRNDTTYSALDLGAPLDGLMNSFSTLATALDGTGHMDEIYDAWYDAAWWSGPTGGAELTDLADFAGKLADSAYVPDDAAVRNAAAALLGDLPAVVIRHLETGGDANKAGGLSILAPSDAEWPYYSDEYPKLALAQDTDWDEFIGKFTAYTATLPSD